MHVHVRHRAAIAAVMAVMLATWGATTASAHGGRHHGHGRHVVVRSGQSIQAAIDAASPYTTIIVFGHHTENVAITKDGIRLIGMHATLTPAATPLHNACFDPSNPTDINGICVLGDVNMATGVVNREIRNVMIKGFTISGFSDSGIVALGAHNAQFIDNVANNNDTYGITAFSSTATKMLFNRASGAGEAGFYVGDSPHANAQVIGNQSWNSLFGILIRNAEHGWVVANRFHDNCVGVVVLADAPGPAGMFWFKFNHITNNTKACPAGEDAPFPLSGVGVGLIGANGVHITHNVITGNVPGGPTAFQGGIVLAKGMGGTVPTANRVWANVIRHNQPDLFSDGSGTDNVFANNHCQTSTPAGLCT
jgi:hypothetical protein